MANELYFDAQVSPAITEVIGNAKEWVVLVSPYVDLGEWDHAKQSLELAIKKGVDVRLSTDDTIHHAGVFRALVNLEVGRVHDDGVELVELCSHVEERRLVTRVGI